MLKKTQIRVERELLVRFENSRLGALCCKNEKNGFDTDRVRGRGNRGGWGDGGDGGRGAPRGGMGRGGEYNKHLPFDLL